MPPDTRAARDAESGAERIDILPDAALGEMAFFRGLPAAQPPRRQARGFKFPFRQRGGCRYSDESRAGIAGGRDVNGELRVTRRPVSAGKAVITGKAGFVSAGCPACCGDEKALLFFCKTIAANSPGALKNAASPA